MATIIAPERLRRVLVTSIAVVALAGLATELVHHLWLELPLRLRGFLSLSYEANVPTWLSSCLLFSCGLMLAAVATRVAALGAPLLGRWRLLSAFFFYMSLDELVGLHEHLGDYVHLSGVLYYGWVVLAAPVVALMAILYVPLVRDLPPGTRARVIAAGGMYLAGAFFMELPLGYWVERAGDESLGYALIDWLGETLEMLGAGFFLATMRAHLDWLER